MEDLTDEQRERIARNRQLALERKRKRELESGQDAQRKHGAFTPGRSLSSGSQCVSEATDVSRATSQIHSFKEQAPSAVNYTSGSAAIQSHHERCSATTSDSTVPSSGSSCTLPVTSHSLTAEQQAIREKNRLLAIERRKRVLQQQHYSNVAGSTKLAPIFEIKPGNSASSTQPSNSATIIPTTTTAPSQSYDISPPSEAIPIKFNCTVTYEVYNQDKFKATVTPFDMRIVSCFRKVPSSEWLPKRKMWLFSLSDLTALNSVLADVQDMNVRIEAIPDHVVRLLREEEKGRGREGQKTMERSIEPSLLNIMFPYQRRGVSFGLDRGGRVLIADEMGLGKSLQALAIARYFRAEWPLVIVCPSSVKSTWKVQINKFLPIIQRIHLLEKGSDPLPDTRTSNTVIIMSYEQMSQRSEQLMREAYGVYVLDESHYLKDGKAKRTKVATQLAHKCHRVILLSGTPALSRPSELFSQIRIVNRNIFTNFQSFALRYCDGKDGKWGFEANGCTNSAELSAILCKKAMIRRLKSEVLSDLPEKRREIIYLPSGKVEERMANFKEAHRKILSNPAFQNQSFNPREECLVEYYTMTGTAKAHAVCDHISDNYFYPDAPPRKVLIFAHHHVVLDTICAELHKKNVEHIRIDGSTRSSLRGELCERFQTDSVVRAAVLSITAAGVGITLTAASVVIFAEIYFIPGALLQAEDRAHRVGQKDSVFVQYMLARNTADDMIWPMIQNKLEVLGQVNLSSETLDETRKKRKNNHNGY